MLGIGFGRWCTSGPTTGWVGDATMSSYTLSPLAAVPITPVPVPTTIAAVTTAAPPAVTTHAAVYATAPTTTAPTHHHPQAKAGVAVPRIKATPTTQANRLFRSACMRNSSTR